jgi:hypothetical protein
MEYTYLIQKNFMRKEQRAIEQGTEYDVIKMEVNYPELERILSKKFVVPVGTVEFTQRYCELNGFELPDNISYPDSLNKYLDRYVWKIPFNLARSNEFVKPVKTKQFTGCIKSQLTEQVDAEEMVWVSEPVEFLCEYRYYIIDGKVVGYSQYDDGEHPNEPDIQVVKDMVSDYVDAPIGYTIDVGIDSSGRTILVEVNDGWALGLYPWGNMSNRDYVELITRRWMQIIQNEKWSKEKFEKE